MVYVAKVGSTRCDVLDGLDVHDEDEGPSSPVRGARREPPVAFKNKPGGK
jgi:hypothetical protein